MTTVKKPPFILYTVTGEGKHAYWTRIGVMWRHNHAEGFNIDLTAHPISTRIVVLPQKDELPQPELPQSETA